MSSGLPGSAAVVIPNWNGALLLERCLTALAAQTQPPGEVVVVDNGSTDGSVALVRERFPSVRLVVNQRNLGFARAVNQGILAMRGDPVILLNNDTLPEPGCLAALCAPLAADDGLGACAATLVFAHRPDRVNSAGLLVGRDMVALDGYLGAPLARLPVAPWPVFGASGGAAAYRRAALDDAGLFDERFFAYLEDVDLAWRLRLRGWRTVATRDARVTHVYSATAGADSAFKRYHLARNRVWLLVKNVPARLLRRHAAAMLWYDSAALLVALAIGDGAWLRGRRDGLRALLRWLPERRMVQGRVRVPWDELEAALAPRVGPLGVWQARQQVRRFSQRG